MALAKQAARTSSMRAQISDALTEGVSLVSPMLSVCLGGSAVIGGAHNKSLDVNRFGNVKWGAGGTSYDWRVKKFRSTASRSTGELHIRDVDQPDLLDNPSVYLGYQWERTFGIGEGDMNRNRASGPQKIRDILADRIDDAQCSVNAALASAPWAANETNQSGGLTMFSPTNAGNGTTYAGIAMNASQVINGTTKYYWYPIGKDFGSTLTLAANAPDVINQMKLHMTRSSDAGGRGTRRQPDFACCNTTVFTKFVTYWTAKVSIHATGGERPTNVNLLEQGFENIVIAGIPIFWDENYANGSYVAASDNEVLFGFSDEIEVVTTNRRSEGLMQTHSTTDDDLAWLAGKMGVIVTGTMAFVFRNPLYFQYLYH